jgi:dipeptidyl aminopeptidase/acylaminoacyl peptidase
MDKRLMAPEDLCRIRLVVDPQVSPQGNDIVYVLREIDREQDGYRSGLRITSAAGQTDRALTDGPYLDRSPRWSPDARWVGFISNRCGTDQLWVVPSKGGSPQRLTDAAGAVSSCAWAPSGRRLAFLARVEARTSAHPPTPGVHVVTRLRYRTDRAGLWDGRYTHIHLLAFDDGDGAAGPVEVLTHGLYDVQCPVWSPDGTRIAFLANPSPDADETATLEVWIVDAKGGPPVCLSTMPGPKAGLSWSPDGKLLAFAGHEDALGGYHTSWGLWVLPVAAGPARRITAGDLGIGDRMLTDLFGFEWQAGPIWGEDGRLYALANVRESTSLIGISPISGELTTVTSGNQHVYTFDVRGHSMAWGAATPTEPSSLYTNGQDEPITQPNRQLCAQLTMSVPEAVAIKNPDGTECEGWLLLPPRRGESRVPLILHVHGGPHAQYGHTFMHEFQLLAARGYAVVYVNPRGSTGYGDAFAGASRHAWGQGDYVDLMCAVDAVIGDPRIDPSRLGVTGGSYGGYMTNWIVAHTDRFRAAVTDRSLSNLVSFMGTSKIAQTFGICELGRVSYADPSSLVTMSPLTFVDRITTPLLILHSEDDYQTPIEQAEQLYFALRVRKRPVEFVRFDDETHELSRSGRPSHRLARLHHLLRWFDAHLGG